MGPRRGHSRSRIPEPPLTVTRVGLDDGDAQQLISELNADIMATHAEGSHFWGLTAEEVSPGRGAFLVLHLDGEPVGCGAVRTIGPGVAELKRMFVKPVARNKKLGAVLVDSLEREARAVGATRLLLETALYLEPAVRVYERAGFTSHRGVGRVRRVDRQLLHGEGPRAEPCTVCRALAFGHPWRPLRSCRSVSAALMACRSSRRGWERVLTEIGFSVSTVAGDGPVDRLVPGLAIAAGEEPSVDEVKAALDGFDLVVVENLLTIPINLTASRVVAEVLRGRPTVLHHHDPPWQRERYALVTELPADDTAWRHVVISELTRVEMLARAGIDATKIANAFDVDVEPGRRDETRARLGVAPMERLLLHPSRAIARKNVPAAVALAEATEATYWLTGPAEEGYGPDLDLLLDATEVRVLRTPLEAPITVGGRIRRVRRRRLSLDVGGLRQPTDRSGDPPTPRRGGALPDR